MFDFIFNRKNSVPRPSLYCVWIRAHEGRNAPLIRVWIDPEMSMFDSQAKVHEPDLAAAIADEKPADEPPGLFLPVVHLGGSECHALMK